MADTETAVVFDVIEEDSEDEGIWVVVQKVLNRHFAGEVFTVRFQATSQYPVWMYAYWDIVNLRYTLESPSVVDWTHHGVKEPFKSARIIEITLAKVRYAPRGHKFSYRFLIKGSAQVPKVLQSEHRS